MDRPAYTFWRCDAPWGDYGKILVHGMTNRLGRRGERLQLERAGPQVPAITLPGIHDLIVTDAVRAHLARFPGLEFRNVDKARIVRLDWHLWDLSAGDPPLCPASGEPEDYILERDHDPACADEIGALWELVPAIIPAIQMPGGLFNRSAWNGEPFVCPDESGGRGFLSASLAEALEALDPEWVMFVEAVEA